MRKASMLMALGLGAMMEVDSQPIENFKSNKASKPKQPPQPKGTKKYFFDSNGEFSTTPKEDTVFTCFAINDKNAIRKFNNRTT